MPSSPLPDQTSAAGMMADCIDALQALGWPGSSGWYTTAQVAEQIGVEWAPGGVGLRPVRDALYALTVNGAVEQRPRHGGHLWRLHWRLGR